ncbi:hypothetical protein [Bradyrhizobium tropiciagri]|uniref:hypothetical protein n=1 Tax=Bradyrhizobium tropiciagri TaxID=312253 RepID=UPI003221C4B1
MREAGYTIGQQNPVDPVLNVGVLVAHVKITRARRVLVDAWKLQHDIAELGGVALREAFEIPLAQLIVRRASLGHDDAVAPLVEILSLLHDLTIGCSLGLFCTWHGRRCRCRIALDLPWRRRSRPPTLDWGGDAGFGQNVGSGRLRLHGWRRLRSWRFCGLLGRGRRS